MPLTRLVILGKQGAGKGTQAERLARRFDVPRISTGDMFRAAVRSGSESGGKAKQYMDGGELVPDEAVVALVRDRLAEDDARTRGFVMEGFPRNVAQAQALDEILAPDLLDLVLELQVPTDTVLGRLALRRACLECGTNYSVASPPSQDWTCDVCGGKVVIREDDNTAAIARRLSLYEERTAPLVAWYMATDRVAVVDGSGEPDVVTGRLMRAVESRLARR